MSAGQRMRAVQFRLALAGTLLLCSLAMAAGPAGLAPAAADDVAAAYAFPVPWAPRSGNPANGTAQGGITFINLPSQGTVKIYSVSGKMVRSLPITAATLQLNWDGRNSGGAEVASGIYFWRIQSGAHGKTGKLVVIR